MSNHCEYCCPKRLVDIGEIPALVEIDLSPEDPPDTSWVKTARIGTAHRIKERPKKHRRWHLRGWRR